MVDEHFLHAVVGLDVGTGRQSGALEMQANPFGKAEVYPLGVARAAR
jgi:hypothetical protein